MPQHSKGIDSGFGLPEATKGPRSSSETAHRLAALAEYWGDRPLSAVNGKTCRDYVEHAGSAAAARRHLEDFRAVIIHHRREGFCSEVIEVVLPEKSPPRERWSTRSEAARLLWACWRGGQGDAST
jgi:hypothetical protein